MAQAFQDARGCGDVPVTEECRWSDIFPSDGDLSDDGDPDGDEYDDEYDSDIGDDVASISDASGNGDRDNDLSIIPGYDSDNELSFAEAYVRPYVRPQWEPPHIAFNIAQIGAADRSTHGHPWFLVSREIEISTLLHRGATVEMITQFEMSYSHFEGITAIVGDPNEECTDNATRAQGKGKVYLGWTVRLIDDDRGQEYMMWIVGDIRSRPERWEYTEAGPEVGPGRVRWCARRLLRATIGEPSV